MKAPEKYEVRKMSFPGDKSDPISISEDERDIIEATALCSAHYLQRNETDQIGDQEKAQADGENSNSFISPTTATVIKENNQVLCPLSQKTRPLTKKYCGMYAKLTFVSPNGEMEDETMDSYATAASMLKDALGGNSRITCTCCTDCKFCRRFGRITDQQQKIFIDAAVQTDLIPLPSTITEYEQRNGDGQKSKNGPLTIEDKPDTTTRVVCTYLAEASEEFYPFSKIEKHLCSEFEEPATDTVHITSQMRQQGPSPSSPPIGRPEEAIQTRRRLHWKGKEAGGVNGGKETAGIDGRQDLFLEYLKYLILRQKTKFRAPFWDTYGAEFKTPVCMNTKEIERCKRRFGDGYDADQLERMFPLALRSSTPDWRRECAELNAQRKECDELNNRVRAVKEVTPMITQSTQTDHKFYQADALQSSPRREGRSAPAKPLGIRTIGSSPYRYQFTPTPSKIRLNRAAVLRADAIHSKYLKV